MKNKGRCIIFAAGDFRDPRLDLNCDDFIIAADAGLENCSKCGLKPNLVIGDFDSMNQPKSFEILRFPVEKDDTDTMLAIKKGIELGYCEFHIIGGAGGERPDHTLANIQSLTYLANKGLRGFMYDGDYVFTSIKDSKIEIPQTKDWAVMSVFALAGTAKGVTITGVQYPVEDGQLSSVFPLGVSNHITSSMATVEVKNGILTICWERGGADE